MKAWRESPAHQTLTIRSASRRFGATELRRLATALNQQLLDSPCKVGVRAWDARGCTFSHLHFTSCRNWRRAVIKCKPMHAGLTATRVSSPLDPAGGAIEVRTPPPLVGRGPLTCREVGQTHGPSHDSRSVPEEGGQVVHQVFSPPARSKMECMSRVDLMVINSARENR